MWQRMLIAAAVCSAIAVSLLVFPNLLLWMVGFWLACFSIGQLRESPAWFPLLACVAVVLVKRPDWTPWLTLLIASIVATALWRCVLSRSKSPPHRPFRSTVTCVIWLLWLIAQWESYHATHCGRSLSLDPSRPLVCLGNSLTSGLTDHEAYPAYLQSLVTIPVINLGRAGVRAHEALQQLSNVRQLRPQAVVLELGGHDFLRGRGRMATRDCLVRLIEGCQDSGAAVLLVEIPRGFVVDPWSGLERELARTYDLQLLSDSAIRQLVLHSPSSPLPGVLARPHLSDDGLHPNARGASQLASRVCNSLQQLFGAEIVRQEQ